MRLHMTKTEAEWLLKATRAARDETNFNMKGIMGDLALHDLALHDLACKLLAQINSAQQKEEK